MPDIGRVAKEVSTKLFTARTLAGAGVLHPGRPDHVLGAVRALVRFGPTPACSPRSPASGSATSS